MSLPKVSVIVLNFNRKEMVLRCLNSVLSSKYSLFEIILVDNGSIDGSVEAVKENFPRVRIIENQRNYGASEGKNIGLRYFMETDADYVYLLDNDIVTDENSVSELVKVAQSNPQIGVVGAKIYNLEVPNEFYGAGCIIDYTQNIGWGRGKGEEDQSQYDVTEEVDALLGGAIFVKKEILKIVGLFDNKFLGYWYEAQDYCFRVRKHGYKVFFAHKAKTWHAPHANDYSYRKKYLAGRNAIYFMRKHASMTNWIKFLFYSIGGIFYAFIYETPRGNLMGVIGKARGLFDGLLGRKKYAQRLLNL